VLRVTTAVLDSQRLGTDSMLDRFGTLSWEYGELKAKCERLEQQCDKLQLENDRLKGR
jgi:regulator of replication initiation timing